MRADRVKSIRKQAQRLRIVFVYVIVIEGDYEFVVRVSV